MKCCNYLKINSSVLPERRNGKGVPLETWLLELLLEARSKHAGSYNTFVSILLVCFGIKIDIDKNVKGDKNERMLEDVHST